MPVIHPTAIIEGDCTFADDVEIGPWCLVRGPVTLGAGVKLVARVNIDGPVEIGAGTILYPGACIGFPPQDVKFSLGDPTAGVRIGSNVQVRELVTINAATSMETPTIIGDNVFMMVQSHVGHDAHIDHGVVLVNNAAIAGHAYVGERATLAGCVGVHQFTRIGKLAFVTGMTGVPNDVPPFCMVGDRNLLTGINVVGMRRAGYDRADISKVREAFRAALRDPMPTSEMIEVLRERGAVCEPVMEMATFIEQRGKRAICSGAGRPPRALAYWLQKIRRGEELPEFSD